MIETGFGKEFSEPPNVTVSGARTHCDACKEPLDPSVMHKCHGNQEYQAPVISSTEITEACPDCGGAPVLVERKDFQSPTYVLVCGTCRTFVASETLSVTDAIYGWNLMAPRKAGMIGNWPKWRAGLPGDDERANVIPQTGATGGHPDLTNYNGACPDCHRSGSITKNCKYCNGSNENCETCGGLGEFEVACARCEGTGTIPPTKGDAP